jgi:hypothetical protein
MINFFFNIYLKLVLIIIFLPISIFVNILKLKKKDNHNFIKNNFTKSIKIFKVNFYSPLSIFIFIFIAPFLMLFRYSKLELFKPKKIKIRQTPKQIASVVAYRVLNNLRLTNKISDINKFQYIFILQPLLLVSEAITDLDKKLIHHISNQQYDRFSYETYCRQYYKYLKEAISQDKELKNKFRDFSKIFSNIQDQRFVDPVHFGNQGQFECAELISKLIIDQEKNLK